MDSYSSFYKGIVVPALSAATLTAAGVSQFDMQPSNATQQIESSNLIEYHLPYSSVQDSNSNKTIGVNTDLVDLMTIKSFAKKILDGMVPVQESIQAVIDDYFWEML